MTLWGSPAGQQQHSTTRALQLLQPCHGVSHVGTVTLSWSPTEQPLWKRAKTCAGFNHQLELALCFQARSQPQLEFIVLPQ